MEKFLKHTAKLWWQRHEVIGVSLHLLGGQRDSSLAKVHLAKAQTENVPAPKACLECQQHGKEQVLRPGPFLLALLSPAVAELVDRRLPARLEQPPRFIDSRCGPPASTRESRRPRQDTERTCD